MPFPPYEGGGGNHSPRRGTGRSPDFLSIRACSLWRIEYGKFRSHPGRHGGRGGPGIAGIRRRGLPVRRGHRFAGLPQRQAVAGIPRGGRGPEAGRWPERRGGTRGRTARRRHDHPDRGGRIRARPRPVPGSGRGCQTHGLALVAQYGYPGRQYLPAEPLLVLPLPR